MTGINIAGAAPLLGIVPYYVTGEIWTVSREGSTPFQVTSGNSDTDPDMVPSGTGRIVFLRDVGGFTRLFIVDQDGSNDTQLDATNGVTAPMWSPDGSLILYNGAGVMTTIEPDGTNETAIVPSGPTGGAIKRPTWNRNGTLIGFQYEKTGIGVAEELWVCDADGTNAVLVDTLTNTGLGGMGFSWANSQDVIAYTRGSSDDNVYIVNADGTGKTNLTSGAVGNNINLSRYAWSTDDSTIFAVRTATPWAIWEIPSSGGGAAVSPTLNTDQSVGSGYPYVFGNRVYTVDSDCAVVSIAFDGSDLRVEDPGDSCSTLFPALQGNTTGL